MRIDYTNSESHDSCRSQFGSPSKNTMNDSKGGQVANMQLHHSEIDSPHPIATELRRKGYSYFPGAAIETPGELNDEAVALLKEFDQLPPDPFAQQTLRHRRLGYFLALPWKGEIVPRPGSSYAQSAYHNPEDGGNQRTFESLTPAIASNGFLQALIRFDLRQIPFGAPNFPQAVDVGVHMVRMVATHDHPGISSPNCLHKDGEPYTFIHLIQREGVEGGESVVADNDRRELFRKTLTDALDTVVVDDRAVYHQITPITSNSAVRGGFRDVLLIDFTPLVRELTQ